MLKRGATRRRCWGLALTGGLLAVGAVPAGTGDCPQLLVNSETVGREQRPDLLVRPDGSFVVVWDREVTLNHNDIRARIFRADDSASGPEFVVNAGSTGAQTRAAVEGAPDGSFVVVWQRREGTDYGIHGRRFAAAGAPLGTDFQVNTSSPGRLTGPSVAADAEGDFVVVWAADGGAAYGQLFAADGQPVGSELTISSGLADEVDVAAAPDGSFVVTWSASEFGSEIRGRRFAADGTPLDAEFQVNTSTASFHAPAVEVAPDGGFAVAMEVSEDDVRLRRYDADGLPLGDELEIPSRTIGYPRTPDLGFRADGEFAVVWSQLYVYLRGHLRGHRLDAEGDLRGRDFQIDCLETYRPYMWYPAVEATSAGEFLVVWASEDDDIDGPNGIYRRRFDEEFFFVFADGFESGDTGAWAGTVP